MDNGEQLRLDNHTTCRSPIPPVLVGTVRIVLRQLKIRGSFCLEPSNNLAERCVKPFVAARKVFQTSGSEAGARHTVALFSIIRTAIINGMDPYRYLEYALENVGKKPIGGILPYSKDLENR